MGKKVILCVDDENIILQSLKSELIHLFGYEYTIEIAESGDEALEVLDELMEDGQQVVIAIIDYIMPGMKGDELSEKIHKISPETQKIMLSGQATIEGVTNAVNRANLFRYIEKPWEREELRNAIKQAMQSYDEAKGMQEESAKLEEAKKQLEQKIHEGMDELARLQGELDTNQPISSITKLSQHIRLFKKLSEPLSKLKSNMDALEQRYTSEGQDKDEDVKAYEEKLKAFEDMNQQEIQNMIETLENMKNCGISEGSEVEDQEVQAFLKEILHQLKKTTTAVKDES